MDEPDAVSVPARDRNVSECAGVIDFRTGRDDLGQHDLPRYLPLRSMDENVRLLARPMWGKATSECAWLLAGDVVDDVPSSAMGRTARGWAAGVLCVVAVDVGMRRNGALWQHILNDITTMTGVSRRTALRRWAQLRSRGLLVPKNAPPWCRQAPDRPQAPEQHSRQPALGDIISLPLPISRVEGSEANESNPGGHS